MTFHPPVSVVIPAYNAGRHLEETLLSVCSQTHANFEVWIVDDGSTDDTPGIAWKFVSKDNRFHFIHQSNHGVSVARNRAIEKSSGEFIAFLDADDVWLPNKLRKQLAALQTMPDSDFSFTNYYNWDGHADLGIRYKNAYRVPRGDLLSPLTHSCLFGISTVMVSKALLASVGGFCPDVSPAEDWDMWLRIFEHGCVPYALSEPLARYRIWHGSASRNTVRMHKAVVRVLRKALLRQQPAKRMKLYQRALSEAHSKLKLARARKLLDSQPEKVPATVWRAWRLNPRNLRWFFRWALVAWPSALGGKFTAVPVHRKLRQKF